MKWRIWESKLLLLLRIKNHEMGVLCRQVYEEGRSNRLPGLWLEVRDICEEIGIPDVNDYHSSKDIVKNAIHEHHHKVMKEELSTATGKLAPINSEDFRKVQCYFDEKSIDTCRTAFKIRSQMLPDIPGNFKKQVQKKSGK